MLRKKMPFVGIACLLALQGCELSSSVTEIDERKLARIKEIGRSCEIPGNSATRLLECIEKYAADKGVPIASLILDAREQAIVFDSPRCAESRPRYPYAVGRNGRDECGAGDDIIVE
jgi:hypothetical protein